ncbi:MAG TPA: aldehyde dehydrogenase family protein [Jatrophihabitantaceae bacterium]|jgi:acyl-CoA reductase-like NAD-dependent aldehyde dehydrogenase
MTQTAPPMVSDPLHSVNPATGAVIAILPVHGAEAVQAAVDQAREAAPWWAGLSFGQRATYLLRWRTYLHGHADELVELIHTENGKPHEDAYLELALVLEHIAWAAKHASKVLGRRRVGPGLLMSNHQAVVEQRPLGVVGVIGPWNYPIYTPAGSAGYALAAGDTVVFKPSEHTPAIGVFFADAFGHANPDVRPGVLSVVTGFGETGAALCRAGVNKIAFTGSTATGKKIMAACAETLTPVVLELGGKDAFIVAPDADVTAAADAAAWGAMANSGQTCVGVERVYVTRDVRDKFLAALQRSLRNVRPGTEYGPMTMPGQVDVVRRHIADALEHGGTTLVGGLDSVRPPYVEPVVLVDTDETSAAVQEETFGPTLTVRTVDSVAEAISLANATRYGLASTVFSRRHGLDIARQLRVGMTSVNSVLSYGAIPALPFGGVGDSGFGRIHGAEGLREFSRTHAIARQRFAVPGMALLSFRRSRAAMAITKRLVKLLHGRAR